MVDPVPALAVDGGPKAHPGPWPAWPQPAPEDAEAVAAVVRAGTWCAAASGAGVVRGFEKAFAALHAPPDPAPAAPLDCVAVANGTAGLTLSLEATGIGPGDEVIVPPYTFIATASAVVTVGAVPVFADVDPDTLCLDPAAVAAAWTPRTKAVIPVHLGGCPANLPALAALCRERGAVLIEDACQAPGAAWAGRPVGTWGTLGCFSFQESKNLSAGEGGAVTGCGEPLEIVRSLHNCGRTPGGEWYGHARVGRNLRMTGLQAALLRSALPRFADQQRRRSAAADRLGAVAAAVPGIRPLLPPGEVTRHAWHLFVLRYDRAAFGGRSRADFLGALAAEGVPCSGGYVLLSANEPLYRRAKENAALGGLPEPRWSEAATPVAASASAECCWLFQSLLLAPEADIESIGAALAKIQRAWG